MSLFKINITKHCSKLERDNNVYRDGKKPRKTKIKRQLESNIIRDIKRLFQQEEGFYKSMRAGNFWSKSYIEYEINGDKSQNQSIKEYLDKIEPYLKDIVNNLQKSI